MPALAIAALGGALSTAIPIAISGGLGALFTTSALTTIAASALASAALSALQGIGSRAEQPQPSLLVRQSQPVGNFVFGRCRVQRSAVTFADNVGGDLWLVVPIACHQINKVVALYDGDAVMWTDASGVEADYAGQLEVYTRLGTDNQAAVPELIAAFDYLDANFRGRGIAYVVIKLIGFATNWGNQPPQLWADVEGAVVYDPRTSSNVYTANAALCANFYATRTRGGPGLTAIDETYLIAAANICDEWVDDEGSYQADGFAVWDKRQNGGTWQHRRYEVNGTFSSGLEAVDILNRLMVYMLGKISYSRGVYRMLAGAYTATVASYTSADLLAPPRLTGALKIEERLDGVRGTFANPAALFQPDDFPEVRFSTPTPVGEAPAYLDMDLSAEIHPERARRLAAITGNLSFRQALLALTLPVGALAHEAGDTINFTMSEIALTADFEIETVRIRLDPENPGVAIEARETGTAFWSYDGSAVTPVPPTPSVGVGGSGRPAPPSGVSAVSATYVQSDQSVIGAIDVQIGGSSDFYVTDYLLKWEIGGQVISSLRTGGDLRHRITGVAVGDEVTVTARAINARGRRSAAVTATVTVTADTTPPAVPIGWTGQAGFDTITLSSETRNTEIDFRGYRIYAADSLTTDLTLISEVTATTFTRRPPSGDAYTRYKISAIDYAGNESARTAFINVVPVAPGIADLDPDVEALIDTAQATADANYDDVQALGAELLGLGLSIPEFTEAEILRLRASVSTETITFVPSTVAGSTRAFWGDNITGAPEVIPDFTDTDWTVVTATGRLRCLNLPATGGSNSGEVYTKQVIPVSEGDEVRADLSVLVVNTGQPLVANGMGLRIEWLDDSFASVGSSFIFVDVTPDGQDRNVTTGSRTAPAGAAFARLGVYFRAQFTAPVPSHATIRQLIFENITESARLDGRIDQVLALDVNEVTGTAFGTFLTDIQVQADANTASASLNASAIATIEGYQAAMAGFEVQAGNVVALNEIYAIDDPGGTSLSLALISADQILLEGSVTAQELTITEGWGNLIDNGKFRWGDFRGYVSVPAAWEVRARGSGGIAQTNSPTPFCLFIPQDSVNRGMDAQEFQCQAGDEFSIRFDYATGGGTRDVTMDVRVEWYDADGAYLSLSNMQVANVANTSWNKTEDYPTANTGAKIVTAPANAASGQIRVFRPGGGSGEGYMANLEMTRLADGAVIIRDGTVISSMINTTNFSAAGLSIFGGSLQSSNFSTGSAGWIINNNGNAEFNNLIVRSSLVVGSVSDFDVDTEIASYAATGPGDQIVTTVSITNVSPDRATHFTFSCEIRPKPVNAGNSVALTIYRRQKEGGTWSSFELVYNPGATADQGWTADQYEAFEFLDVQEVEYQINIAPTNGSGDPTGLDVMRNIIAKSQSVQR